MDVICNQNVCVTVQLISKEGYMDEFQFVLTSSCVLCEHVVTVQFALLKC